MKTFMLATSLVLFIPITAALAQEAAGADHPIPVPEPSTLALAAVGIIGALIASRFRNKK